MAAIERAVVVPWAMARPTTQQTMSQTIAMIAAAEREYLEELGGPVREAEDAKGDVVGLIGAAGEHEEEMGHGGADERANGDDDRAHDDEELKLAERLVRRDEEELLQIGEVAGRGPLEAGEQDGVDTAGKESKPSPEKIVEQGIREAAGDAHPGEGLGGDG